MAATATPTRPPSIRLVIVDDHSLVRDGLRARLSVVPGLQVIGEAASGAEALLVDVGMRGMNGIELAAVLREHHPQIRVLMLSMYDNREYVLSAIRAGARGYVLKESPTEEVITAIGAIWAGGNYFSAQVANMVALGAASVSQLTGREHEILLLLAHGSSNKGVARQLDISVRTVETHRLSLRRKLGVDSASELLKIAVTKGWTTL